jgi:hypothetical protein
VPVCPICVAVLPGSAPGYGGIQASGLPPAHGGRERAETRKNRPRPPRLASKDFKAGKNFPSLSFTRGPSGPLAVAVSPVDYGKSIACFLGASRACGLLRSIAMAGGRRSARKVDDIGSSAPRRSDLELTVPLARVTPARRVLPWVVSQCEGVLARPYPTLRVLRADDQGVRLRVTWWTPPSPVRGAECSARERAVTAVTTALQLPRPRPPLSHEGAKA